MIKRILAIFMILTLFSGCTISGTPYDEQIKLGYKLLEQGQYAEAILAFDKAIEIDVKRDKAYIGKAETYLAKGGEDMLININESLKTGYELTHSEKIVDAYVKTAETLCFDEDLDSVAQILEFGYLTTASDKIVNTYLKIANVLSEQKKYGIALDLLQKGCEVTANDKLKEKIVEILGKNSSSFLQNLYELFESGNIEEVKNKLKSNEFSNIASYATDIEPAFYSPISTSNAKSGRGLGVYLMEGQFFVYFGEYANNVRSGDGLWMQCINSTYIFDGHWVNDKPNGMGKATTTDTDKHEAGDWVFLEYSGELVNGLWNGDVYQTIKRRGYYEAIDTIFEEVSLFNYKDGIVTIIRTANYKTDYPYIVSTPVSGGLPNGLSANDSYIDKLYGIRGFTN